MSLLQLDDTNKYLRVSLQKNCRSLVLRGVLRGVKRWNTISSNNNYTIIQDIQQFSMKLLLMVLNSTYSWLQRRI